MISGAGSVYVNSSRAERRKEVAMSATASKSNSVASDPSAIEFK